MEEGGSATSSPLDKSSRNGDLSEKQRTVSSPVTRRSVGEVEKPKPNESDQTVPPVSQEHVATGTTHIMSHAPAYQVPMMQGPYFGQPYSMVAPTVNAGFYAPLQGIPAYGQAAVTSIYGVPGGAAAQMIPTAFYPQHMVPGASFMWATPDYQSGALGIAGFMGAGHASTKHRKLKKAKVANDDDDDDSDSADLSSDDKVARIKGAWSKKEDKKLTQLVTELGPRWSLIAERLPGRIGKQCRERYLNHLDNAIKRTPWSASEDSILLEAHKVRGNKWSEIARLLPGRPENAVKNRYMSLSHRLSKLTPNNEHVVTRGTGGGDVLETSPLVSKRTEPADPSSSDEGAE